MRRRAKRLVSQGETLGAGSDTSFFSDFYHHLVTSSWPVLLGYIVIGYGVFNGLFALIYYLDGGVEGARPGSYLDMLFFSVQTMATIGYGKLTPVSLLANALVSFEALFGLVALAMMTGLMFAKFSLPTARVRFSEDAVISNRDGVPTLMFRMANLRANRIVEAQIHVTLTVLESTLEGDEVRRWYDLAMVRDRSSLFALSWTAQHRVTENSPLFGATPESLESASAGVTVLLTGLDETFSQTIHARHFYTAGHIRFGKRLADIMTFAPAGDVTVDYARFDSVVDAPAE